MAYSEIINEIQEQIDEVLAQIASRNQRLQELQDEIANFQSQVTGLEALRAQTQTLIDSQGGSNLNLNINVTTDSGARVNHSVS